MFHIDGDAFDWIERLVLPSRGVPRGCGAIQLHFRDGDTRTFQHDPVLDVWAGTTHNTDALQLIEDQAALSADNACRGWANPILCDLTWPVLNRLAPAVLAWISDMASDEVGRAASGVDISLKLTPEANERHLFLLSLARVWERKRPLSPMLALFRGMQPLSGDPRRDRLATARATLAFVCLDAFGGRFLWRDEQWHWLMPDALGSATAVVAKLCCTVLGILAHESSAAWPTGSAGPRQVHAVRRDAIPALDPVEPDAVGPFGQAFGHALTTWSKLMPGNPDRLRLEFVRLATALLPKPVRNALHQRSCHSSPGDPATSVRVDILRLLDDVGRRFLYPRSPVAFAIPELKQDSVISSRCYDAYTKCHARRAIPLAELEQAATAAALMVALSDTLNLADPVQPDIPWVPNWQPRWAAWLMGGRLNERPSLVPQVGFVLDDGILDDDVLGDGWPYLPSESLGFCLDEGRC